MREMPAAFDLTRAEVRRFPDPVVPGAQPFSQPASDGNWISTLTHG